MVKKGFIRLENFLNEEEFTKFIDPKTYPVGAELLEIECGDVFRI